MTGPSAGTAPTVTDPRLEDALILAETALSAAKSALEQAEVAERAADLSVGLAREALRAAHAAHVLAGRVRAGEEAG
jgi:hypothetical protein